MSEGSTSLRQVSPIVLLTTEFPTLWDPWSSGVRGGVEEPVPEALCWRESRLGGQRPLCPLPAGLYVLVGAGALMMAVGFFGCCGAMRESQCVLGSVSGAPVGKGGGTGLKGARRLASSARCASNPLRPWHSLPLPFSLAQD